MASRTVLDELRKGADGSEGNVATGAIQVGLSLRKNRCHVQLSEFRKLLDEVEGEMGDVEDEIPKSILDSCDEKFSRRQ